MFYTVYKITHIDSGKIYIGAHKTKNLDDGYMGSGRVLRRAQKKYGIERFTKEILHVFDNKKDMFSKEAELVNEDFVKRVDTYNLKEGGYGGFDYLNDKSRFNNPAHSEEWIRKLSVIGNANITQEDRVNNGRKGGSSTLLKGKGIHATDYVKPTMTGKKHREESKIKIGLKNSYHQKGEGNSQYGTMWITDGSSNRKVDSGSAIPEGWRRGRVMPKPTCDTIKSSTP